MNFGLSLFVLTVLLLFIFRITLNFFKCRSRSDDSGSVKMLEHRLKATHKSEEEQEQDSEAKKIKHSQFVEKYKLVTSTIISGLVLLAALYIILAEKNSPESEKWAFGAVGTIIGFWLKA